MTGDRRGRPVDAERRARVLHAATDHVLRHGLDDLSLRPLATALGTSPRMLLYDFGSKEQLVGALLDAVRARLADTVRSVYDGRDASRATVSALWAWLRDPANAGYVRLHAQAALLAATRDGGSAAFGDAESAGSAVARDTDSTRSDVLVISTVLHGLALRRLGEVDPAVVDAAADHFIRLVRE